MAYSQPTIYKKLRDAFGLTDQAPQGLHAMIRKDDAAIIAMKVICEMSNVEMDYAALGLAKQAYAGGPAVRAPQPKLNLSYCPEDKLGQPPTSLHDLSQLEQPAKKRVLPARQKKTDSKGVWLS